MSFCKDISRKWNANSLFQDLNVARWFPFFFFLFFANNTYFTQQNSTVECSINVIDILY